MNYERIKKNYLTKFIPRYWSNKELKKISPHLPFGSRIVNVSGWKDKDKEGNYYCNYFSSAAEYHIANYPSDKARGSACCDIPIDLSQAIPKEHIGTYDGVFNHTVLEHLADPVFAFKQMALLTTDWIITVVPFKQKLHFENGFYDDYYRFSPFIMRQLHTMNGLTVIYETYTPKPALDIYLFYVGTKKVENYLDFPKNIMPLNEFNNELGNFNAKMLFQNIIARFLIKYYLKNV